MENKKKGTTRPQRQKVNMNQVARKKKTEAKLKKKSIQIQTVGICKNRSKKSSPDLFNFYVDLAGNDMVTDAGQTTTCRRKFKTPWLQTKVQKMKDHPKMSLTEKRLKISDGKKSFLA